MKPNLRSAAVAAILAVSAFGVRAGAEERHVFVGGADVAAAHARIVHAARIVCEAEYVRGAHRRRELVECIQATTDDAVTQARRADLAAYHHAMAAEERYRDRYQTTVAAVG